MAIVHPDADITPTKQELLATWLPTRPWWPGGNPGEEIETAGSFRFDDPAGDVGVETILVRAGDAIVQAPLTYRSAPLEGAEAHLITTMEHTVLGRRWIYDGCGDPVWAAVTAAAALTGGREADLEVEQDGEKKVFPSRTSARGSGAPGAAVEPTGTPQPRDEGATTVVTAGAYEIVVARVAGTELGDGETLTVEPRDGVPFVAVSVRQARGDG